MGRQMKWRSATAASASSAGALRERKVHRLILLSGIDLLSGMDRHY